MYAGKIRVGLVAALVEQLPPGTAIGRELGGAAALSPVQHSIRQLDVNMRGIAWAMGGKSGAAPEPWELPEGRREIEAREAREAEAKRRWAENSRRRQELQDAGKLTLRDL